MFNRDTIMPLLQQVEDLISFYEKDSGKDNNNVLKLCQLNRILYRLNDNNEKNLNDLYDLESDLSKVINGALSKDNTVLSAHQLVLQDCNFNSVKLDNRATVCYLEDRLYEWKAENKDAYDTLINCLFTSDNIFYSHAAEWLKRNDYAGFRSALSGRPREEFQDNLNLMAGPSQILEGNKNG